MRRAIRFGLRQAALMNLVFIGLVLFAAIWAVPRLPVDRYPNFAFGEATVTVRWTGAAPADIERQVCERIEDAVRGMDDLEFVRSTAIAGQGEVHVKFVDDSDYERLYLELRTRVLAAQNLLPIQDGKPLAPVFAKIETDQWVPLLQIALVARNPARPVELRQITLLTRELQTRLERLPGVKRTDLFGDQPEQLTVMLRPEALRRHGITLEAVAARIAEAGTAAPAGRLRLADGEHLLRADLRYRSREELLAVPLRAEGPGGWLRLADLVDPVATRFEPLPGTTIVSVDGLDTVACKVVKTAQANATELKEAVMAEVDAFIAGHAELPVRAAVSFDSTVPIRDSIGVLRSNLLQGTVLVACILTAFMGLRAAAVTLSGMFMAFLACLTWFWATGASINELSLLGFVIVVGILVDDAVVVLDNITRLREEGRPLDEALVEGAAEVAWPVLSSVATTIASFLPLLLMTGVTGEFFALIPIAVSVALAVSVAEALIMLPLHVQDLDRWFGPPRRLRVGSASAAEGHLADAGLMGRLARAYDRLLTACLRRPWWTVGASGLLFAAAIGVLAESAAAPALGWRPLVRLEFFPGDPSMAQVLVEAPPGTALGETDRLVREITGELLARGPGEVTTATGLAGLLIDTQYLPVWGDSKGMVWAELAGHERRTMADPRAWIAERDRELRERWAPRGVRVSVSGLKGGPPTGLPITVRLRGLDDGAVRAATAALAAWLREEARPGGALDGAIAIATDLDRTEQVTSLRPDRERCAERGIGEPEAVRLAAAVAEGVWAGDLRRSDEDVPVRLRLGADDPVGLAQTPLRPLPDGSALRWGDIGTVATAEEPSTLVRRDFMRTATITGALAPDAALNAFSANALIAERWRAMATAHPGVAIAFGGEAEATSRSYASLGMAFAVSLFLIYTILVLQFRSWLQPLLIMSTIVFAFTGVVLAMGLFGAGAALLGPALVRPERALVTVNTFIAMVALTGMVVNNAIVLIDFINARRRAAPLQTVLRQASHLRLRAILLTSVTTIAGMLPTAIGVPEFSITWSPMAMAFCAGMAMSTVLCLLVVPVLYELLDRHQRRLAAGWRRALRRGFRHARP